MRLSYPALLSAIAFGVIAFATLATGAADSPDASKRLRALFDEAWDLDMRDDPLTADYFGDFRFARQWPDPSYQATKDRAAVYRSLLSSLKRIDRAKVPPRDQLNYDLFQREYQGRLAVQPFQIGVYDMLQPSGGVHTLSETVELLPFRTVQDYEDWIARLATVDRYIDQSIARLRQAIREGRTQPRIIVERAIPLLAKQTPAKAEASPFFEPFTRIPDTIATAERERLIGEAGRAIADKVVPAHRRLEAFLRDEYLPAARTTVGIWDTPDGAAFYRNRVAFHTTTDLTPEAIHELGLREVARIRGEMEAIIRQVEFDGSFADFLDFLRTAPRFYYPTSQELFEAYAVTSKRIEPELVKLFGKLPRMPYGVRPIPETNAPTTTTAYYQGPAMDGTRAGYYYVNLYKPEVRPKYEIEVLTVHEAVPGHHLQIALAMEDKSLPRFRQNLALTAYVEGWALYSERLGEQMGLYKDPYSKFGQLTYEMWRAVRLVVDTGIHAKKWPREQAIEFFKANAAKTEDDIVNEIDRYIAWPGQAVAYKVGQLRILALRDEAEKALGDRFDIRAFHDTVLGTGAVPLDVLDDTVRAWIESQKKQKS